MSCIMESVPASIPLLVEMMGVSFGTWGAMLSRYLREYCTGTAWMMKVASLSASCLIPRCKIDMRNKVRGLYVD